MGQILGVLVEHGVLGIAVIVLGLVIKTLYAQNNKFIDERDKLHTDYQKKYNELVDRYVVKSEQWADKNRELAASANSVLDALMRRVGPGGQ